MTSFKVGFFLALTVVSALAQYQSPQNAPDDDGSYIPEKYEKPWEYNAQIHENPNQQQQPVYQPQPQYQSQPGPQVYQPQPSYSSRSLSDPRNAAILSEARYLNNDGKFGAQYTQDDGVEFKEESDRDGTRHGTYSYVDPSGQRKTVSYTAGKHGFQATGDHLPVGPAGSPVAAPVAPVQQQQRVYQPAAPAPVSYQPQQQQHTYQPAAPAAVYERQPQQAAYQPQPIYRPQVQPPVAASPNSGYTFTSHF